MHEYLRIKSVLQRTIKENETARFESSSNKCKRMELSGGGGYAIYPYGELGKLVKEILNNYFGIYENLIIDNGEEFSSNDLNIVALAQLNKNDLENYIILLASNNEKSYREVRHQILQYVGLEQIVDIFSFSLYFNPDLYYEASLFDYYFKEQDGFRNRELEFIAREIYKNRVEGDIAEVGVYKGGFADWMSRFLPDRTLYLFDTFSGFDVRDITEDEEISSEARMKYNNFSDTSVDIVLNNISYNSNCIIKKGYFPDSINGLDDRVCFSFVSLDTDLAKPIVAGLEYFYPRLSPGGYIIIDNYNCTEFPTVRNAVIKYCTEHGISYICIPKSKYESGAAVIAKPI